MSRVFLARDTALGRLVVVKVLMPSLAAGVSVDRFRREILLAAKLQHPHIVPVHSAGESDGLPYFTMPYVEGESLRARIDREGELPVGDVVRLLRNVASALAYAHGHGVIHRDIKPDNVMVHLGSAMVADFGVAKALSESTTGGGDATRITSMGVALGTPAYMAPEQASGDPSVDHRVDIYAFGIMAYEMLTGRTPFAGRSIQAVLAAHVIEAPTHLLKLRPSVAPALAQLVMGCLEKHAADRPSKAEDLVHALDLLVTTPSGGTPPTLAVRPARRSISDTAVGPGRPRWLAAGVTAIVLLIGGFVLLRMLTRPGQGNGVQSGQFIPALVPPPDSAAGSVAQEAGGSGVEDAQEPVPEPTIRTSRTDRGAGAAAPMAAPSGSPQAPSDAAIAERLRAAALSARGSAVNAGATADQLAAGDSLLARGASHRDAGRWDDAALSFSAAASSWAGVTRAAARPPPQQEPPAAQPPAAQPPTPQQAAQAPVQRPQAQRQPPVDPRPRIEALVAAYAEAVESRSTDRIRAVYPGLTDQQERGWRQFFDATGEIDARLSVTDFRRTGDEGVAAVSGTYQFHNSTTGRSEQQPVAIDMLFRLAGDQWQLVEIR